MAKKRVLAYYMHENEMAACRSYMPNATATESFMMGEVDEADVPRMEQEGLIVQVMDAAPRAPLVERERRPTSPAGAGPSFGTGVRGISEPEFDPAKPNYFRVQLAGPLLEPWREQLDQLGVKLVDSLSGFEVLAKFQPVQLAAVRQLPFVTSARLEGVEDSLPEAREVEQLRTSERTGAKSFITYDVVLREPENLNEVLSFLREHGAAVAASGGNKIRIHVIEDSPLVEDLAALPEVALVEPYIEPEIHNNVARELLGIQSAPGNSPAFTFPFEGEGQVIGVADTGLDDQHTDIAPARRVGVVALGRPGDSSDPHGHGTHVAGSVLGDGTASNGEIRGSAPKARLFFQSLLDARGKLGGLPFRLNDLFDEAFRNGARIHNNSWGAATSSVYRVSSSEVDDYAHSHKDMLIVISAGNDGTDQVAAGLQRHTQTGCVEWLSMGSPATAKNALTVGASQTKRSDPNQGFSQLTYGRVWPAAFRDLPVRDEQVSGNPESMAAFSSRGPCDDRRIKPDLVAPGTDILSCKSSLAPLRNFWGPHTNQHYAYMGGTSMAAPLVSGCAALVREYYKKERNWDASAALVKATLINSTRWLSGSPSIADHPHTPNFHQGFGCIHMPSAVPNSLKPDLKLEFVDNWQDPGQQLTITGQRRRFQIQVAAGHPLRICLAYTDVPGRALQNNLNMFVQGPNGTKFMGNEQLPMSLKIPDPDNNVEIVRLENPAAGSYLIQISASNLLKPPQDFALVVTGKFGGPLLPF